MKNLNYSVLTCVIAMFAFESNASPIYVGIEGGISHANKLDKVDYFNKRAKDSFAYGAKVGYRFNEYFRSDISLMQVTNHKFSDVEDGTTVNQKFSSTVGMINAYYDVPFAKVSLFTPYLAGGIGFAKNKAGDLVIGGLNPSVIAGKTKNQFAWSIGVGVNAEISKHLGIDLSYRYLDLGKFTTTDKFISGYFPDVTAARTKLKTNLFAVGLKVSF